jgi:hypothetical protein
VKLKKHRAQNRFVAAPSAAGYLFQCRYALLAALEYVGLDTGLEISIERFDDVSFETDSKPLELIQTKHHVSHAGDLSNTSPDLWKTLRNWSEAIAQDPSLLRRVRFVLVTTAVAPCESIALFLRPGPSRDESKAYELAVQVASEGRRAANRGYYTSFLKLTEQARNTLIRSILVVDAAVVGEVQGAEALDLRFVLKTPGGFRRTTLRERGPFAHESGESLKLETAWRSELNSNCRYRLMTLWDGLLTA